MARSRVAIVGLGLIGGSIGLALKKSKVDIEIIGHDKDSGVASRALKRGAVDHTKWNLIDACEEAGLIVLALPLDGIKATLAALKPHLPSGVILTDTATTKVPVLEWAKELPEGVHFIGGDPALTPLRASGTHGIDAADPDIFKGATYCLSPSPVASAAAIETVTNLVALVGAKPYFIDPVEHDGLMAGVQHLPALLATALSVATMQSQGWRELGKVAGADFRALTNLAAQDPKTAREQFLAHRTDLVRWIDAMIESLNSLRGMVERGDAAALEELVESLAVERDRWLSGNLEAAPEMDLSAAQLGPLRLFVGGLADRPKKQS